MYNNKFKICIIGAGVIGLAIAEKLSQYYDNIIIIEKESSFGRHISSRNSEVIHSGFYYPQNSLKAKLCFKGNKMIYDFAEKYKIKYKKCGKLIVIHNNKDKVNLLNLKINSEKNGIEGVKILSYPESKLIEPRVKCLQSLWIPSTGIIDSHGLMSKLENLSISRGVDIAYNTKLQFIKKENNKFKLNFKDDCIYSDIVINAGGLGSYEISKKLNINNHKIVYYKGDYFKSKSIKNLNCLLYPMPTSSSLGIHTVLSLNGDVSFGPNIYKVDSINYTTTDKYKEIYLEEINRYIDVENDDIYEDFSGIRPKIDNINIFNDFFIKNEKNSSNKNFINLLGIDSPGLTSSLAIGDYVNSIII